MRRHGRRPAGVGIALAGIALADLVLTTAGCSQVLPLGPYAPPAPSHLATAIALQPVLSQPLTASGGCPAGSVGLPPPGAGFDSPQPEALGGGCYRKLGKPVTLTSAGITVFHVPTGLQGQPGGPQATPAAPEVAAGPQSQSAEFQFQGVAAQVQAAAYGVDITLPAAEAAALKAITTKVAGTQDQLAIIVAGQTWGLPSTLQPLTGGQIDIPVQSRNQALQLQVLLQSG